MKEQDENELPEHILRNRTAWNKWAPQFVESGRKAWQEKEPMWGIWNIPESEAHILPDKIKGLEVIELGCGTAYVSAWLARLGARVTGIDNSEEQLKTAKAQQQEHGLNFPLIHGNAEHVPRPDASFDLAISEYGACIWCDPYLWVPEAARLLRPGGGLIFLMQSPILFLCMADDEKPATPQLVRDYFGMHRYQFPDAEGAVEFHLGYGDWIRVLRKNSFEIKNLIELRPKEGATTGWPYVKADWARRWPSEQAWIARKRDEPIIGR